MRPGVRYPFLKGTANMSSTSSKPVKLIAWFTMVAGILMIVAGGVTWGLVQSQLKDEQITVSPLSPENPGRRAGSRVHSCRGQRRCVGFTAERNRATDRFSGEALKNATNAGLL